MGQQMAKLVHETYLKELQSEYKHLAELIDPCKFQAENYASQLDIQDNAEVEDWEWGIKFHQAGTEKTKDSYSFGNRMY